MKIQSFPEFKSVYFRTLVFANINWTNLSKKSAACRVNTGFAALFSLVVAIKFLILRFIKKWCNMPRNCRRVPKQQSCHKPSNGINWGKLDQLDYVSLYSDYLVLVFRSYEILPVHGWQNVGVVLTRFCDDDKINLLFWLWHLARWPVNISSSFQMAVQKNYKIVNRDWGHVG